MKVIIAFDQSEYADQVVEAVLKRQWPQDTAFKLLTVIEPSPWAHFGSENWQSALKQIAYNRQQLASEKLGIYRAKLSEQIPDCSVHVEIRNGNARGEILAVTTEWMADKLVLGAHGHSPNRLLGKLPQSLAQHAPCTVELIRLKCLMDVAGSVG